MPTSDQVPHFRLLQIPQLLKMDPQTDRVIQTTRKISQMTAPEMMFGIFSFFQMSIFLPERGGRHPSK